MCSYILWRGAYKLTYIIGDFAVTVLIRSVETCTKNKGTCKYNHLFLTNVISYDAVHVHGLLGQTLPFHKWNNCILTT